MLDNPQNEDLIVTALEIRGRAEQRLTLSLLPRMQAPWWLILPVATGLLLAAVAYGNLALRQFGDLDILVHRGDLARAVSVITSHGYELVSDANGSSGGCEKDVALVSLDGSAALDTLRQVSLKLQALAFAQIARQKIVEPSASRFSHRRHPIIPACVCGPARGSL